MEGLDSLNLGVQPSEGTVEPAFRASSGRQGSEPADLKTEVKTSPAMRATPPAKTDSRLEEAALARWLLAQIQLQGFVADEDWTSEHSRELKCFCNDPKRRKWFLWLVEASRRTPRRRREDGSLNMEASGGRRLAFGDEPPVYALGTTLDKCSAKEKCGNGVVFIAKREASVVNPEMLEKQLLCLSLNGSVLEHVAVLMRGICIPVIAANTLWPQSFKKDLLKKAGSKGFYATLRFTTRRNLA